MRTTRHVAMVGLIGMMLSAGFCAAGAFDKEFKLKNVVGTCTVTMPDGASGAAEEGKAYPYGCTVATGRKSSAVMELSSGNEVRILANSTLKADQSAEDASAKTVRLREGRIQVKLEETFHKSNKFTVETPTAVCGAIGCEFTATAAPSTCSFDIQEGEVLVSGAGPYARWSTRMDSGDKIAVAAVGQTMATISNNGGQFQLKYTDANGVEQPIELAVGSKVSVTSQQGVDAQGRPVVKMVIVVTNPDGTVQAPIETIVPLPADTPPPPPPPPGGQPPPTMLDVQTTGTTPTPVGAP